MPRMEMITFREDSKKADLMRAAAEAQGRTLSGWLRWTIDQALRRANVKRKKAAKRGNRRHA